MIEATFSYLCSVGSLSTAILLPVFKSWISVELQSLKFLLGTALPIHCITKVFLGSKPLMPSFSLPAQEVVLPKPLFAKTKIFAIIYKIY